MEKSSQKKSEFNPILAFTEVLVLFVLGFIMVGWMIFDIAKNTGFIAQENSTVSAALQDADFDPGIEVSGDTEGVEKDKIDSLFIQLKNN